MNHQGTKRIETERLILRPFTIEDAPKMYENWASDPEVTKYLLWPTHTGVDVTREVLSGWIAEYEKKEKYEWCIELKETGEPIGSMGAFDINEKVESVEVGYCISKKYWHQGITSEALKAVISYLTEEVGVRRISSRHDVKNSHSGEVMKKCGLQYEGTRIRADWNNSGICDVALYGLVKGCDATRFGAVQGDAATRQGTAAADVADNSAAPQRKNQISDETLDYVGILAKLELSPEEKIRAKKDMESMLDYIDKLNELDTAGVEPMSHIFPVHNVFREDIVENGDNSEAILKNAPAKKDNSFKVPKTVE